MLSVQFRNSITAMQNSVRKIFVMEVPGTISPDREWHQWVGGFHWSNEKRHHSSISLLIPSVFRQGVTPQAIAHRQAVVDVAYVIPVNDTQNTRRAPIRPTA